MENMEEVINWFTGKGIQITLYNSINPKQRVMRIEKCVGCQIGMEEEKMFLETTYDECFKSARKYIESLIEK